MPQSRNNFRRHYIVRKLVWRIEMLAPPIAIKEARSGQVPAHTKKILPGIIKGGVPATRPQLVQILRIGKRHEEPLKFSLLCSAKHIWMGNVCTPHAYVERVFAHVALHRTYLLVDAIEL